MVVIHKIIMKIRKIIILCYYKVVYQSKFVYGKNFNFRSGFRLFIEKTGRITFGNNCFFNNNFSASAMKKIEIGDDCIFGENVKIYDHNHVYSDKSEKLIYEQDYKIAEVIIGKNCWIASNVTILAGVSIGDNCVVGANCLVYKDIEANSIVKHKEELIIN